MRVVVVAGARPNFMKIAPIMHAAAAHNENAAIKLQFRLVHTGQHYDKALSESFFQDLNIPEPDTNLEVGSGSHAEQTANVMIRFEEELKQHPADLLLVVGDVNSTIACAMVAKKMGVKVAHVEAGLRSYDMQMPEEINRLLTDAIADYYYTTTPEAGYNLAKAGTEAEAVHFVGNTMIDSLVANLDRLAQPELFKEHELQEGNFIVMTLHRPSNVDDESKLIEMIHFICKEAHPYKVVFPIHPRTEAKLNSDSRQAPANLIQSPPMRYLEFVYLVKNSAAVVTDSGGIQEETTFLSVPCLTLRENTERPETLTLGTNELLGFDKPAIAAALTKLKKNEWKQGSIPLLWDGRAAERIVAHIASL